MENRSEAGASLVDLMVGVFIGLVLIGAVLSIVTQQGRLRQSNGESTLALSAIANTVERLRSLRESALVGVDNSGFDVPGTNGQPGGLQAVPGDADGLPGNIRTYRFASAGGVPMYHVVVTVDWTGSTGRRRQTFSTLIAERR